MLPNKQKESLEKDDPGETDVPMSKVTLQERRECPATPGLDLDVGDAPGARGPFNQRLEMSSRLVSFHLLWCQWGSRPRVMPPDA